MFATPFTAPLHETLASHVFGRFASQRAPSGGAEAVVPPVPTVSAIEEDTIPDLAQRVRDVGEW